jgi:hypothetical protein
MSNQRDAKSQGTERALFSTAAAALVGYLVLAWAILRHGQSRPPR